MTIDEGVALVSTARGHSDQLGFSMAGSRRGASASRPSGSPRTGPARLVLGPRPAPWLDRVLWRRRLASPNAPPGCVWHAWGREPPAPLVLRPRGLEAARARGARAVRTAGAGARRRGAGDRARLRARHGGAGRPRRTTRRRSSSIRRSPAHCGGVSATAWTSWRAMAPRCRSRTNRSAEPPASRCSTTFPRRRPRISSWRSPPRAPARRRARRHRQHRPRHWLCPSARG